jgi:hypothetical protein
LLEHRIGEASHPGLEDAAAGTGDTATSPLDRWLATLTATVLALKARGAVPAGYTWSNVANPIIWAIASGQGMEALLRALRVLGMGRQVVDLLVDWWRQQGVSNASLAAAWLVARANQLQRGTILGPYEYVPDYLEEDVCEEAVAGDLLQFEVMNLADQRAAHEGRGQTNLEFLALETDSDVGTDYSGLPDEMRPLRDPAQEEAGKWVDDGTVSPERAEALARALIASRGDEHATLSALLLLALPCRAKGPAMALVMTVGIDRAAIMPMTE